MEKCRICFQFYRNMYSINTRKNGISFVDMITSLIKIKTCISENMPNKICSSCCKKLKDAYNFKIKIERNEMVLNESASCKRISFNNFEEVKIQIGYKPIVKSQENVTKYLHNSALLNYNNTVIKKIEEYNVDDKTQNKLTVHEFLNSVKLESDDDYNDFNEDDHNYLSSESGKENPSKSKIKNKGKVRKSNTICKLNKCYIGKPIKPIILNDVLIQHSDKLKVTKLKKVYRYPAQTSICPYCGKLLQAKYLSLHMLKHTDEKSYKCDRCPKSFYTEKLLNYHLKGHTEYGKYKCNQCIAAFNFKFALNTHMLVHTDEKKYICDICSKGFKRKNTLKRHEMTHNFGKKTIQCELCPMTFYTKSFLKNHMRVHTGERPYKCELCSQPYSYKHDFNRHCFKKHGVFLKRRSVRVMNEEVLQQERALMKDLTLRAHGVIKDDNIPSVYEGPLGAIAYAQAMKAVEKHKLL